MVDTHNMAKWSKPGHEDRDDLIYFCPICGSTEIEWIGGLPLLAPHMECKECGHRGVFILGNKESIRDVRENYLQGHEEDRIEEVSEEDE